MFKRFLIVVLILLPMLGMADIAPVTPVAVKAEESADYMLDVLQGESRIWSFQFSETGAVKNLSGANGVVMTYQAGNGGPVSGITGQVTSASGGVAQVKWDSSNATQPGRYRYVCAVVSSNSVLASGKGILTVSRGIVEPAIDAPVWSGWGVWQAALTASQTAYDAATNAVAGITRHNADGVAHSSLFASIRDTATNALGMATMAFGWGDHRQGGYVTGTVLRAESDPLFTGWTTGGFPGVLTTETDPSFTGWIGGGYQGVVTAEADPVFGQWQADGYQGIPVPSLQTVLDAGNSATKSMSIADSLRIDAPTETEVGRLTIKGLAAKQMSLYYTDYGGGIADWTINTGQGGGTEDISLTGPYLRFDLRPGIDSFNISAYSWQSEHAYADEYFRINFSERLVQFGGFDNTGTVVRVAVHGDFSVDGKTVIIPPTSSDGLPVGALWNDGGVLKVVTE